MMKKRVLFIAGFADSLINFRGPLLIACKESGLDVHVAAPGLTQSNSIIDRLESIGCVAHNLPLSRTGINPVIDLITFMNIMKVIHRIRPTHVLGYTIKPVIYGCLAARLLNVPNRFALITGLGYVFTEKGRQDNTVRSFVKYVVKWLYTLSLKSLGTIFFQNPDDAALFRQLGILSAESRDVIVNGSGVDLNHYNRAPVRYEPIHFLLISRLLGNKGVREYAQAARRIKAIYPEVVFSLGGWIDSSPDAIDKIELEGWVEGGFIDYLGQLSDVREALKQCSVFVLPSYREGTPRSVLEAMAMGRPIITTDAPGCRETVREGENGYLVAVRSVDSLVNAMETFIKNPGRVATMGQRSWEIATDKYDVDKVNELMLVEMGI